jgi:hypothetical protein
MTNNTDDELVGRTQLTQAVAGLLAQQRNVLLFGPSGIGKSALIRAFAAHDVMVVDPFERVSAHGAARIRRSMDRGALWIGAAQTLDRCRLGRVGRIAWRFTTIRVPPLSDMWMRRLITRACSTAGIPIDLVTAEWLRAVLNIAQGRPGPGLAIVEQTCHVYVRDRRLPPPVTAYLEAALQRPMLWSKDNLEHWR